MKKIYIFDMGNVITKPTNLKKVYEQSKAKCSYSDFKKIFYDSKESVEVYKGLITDDEFFKIIIDKTNCICNSNELKSIYLKNKSGVYNETIDIIKYLKKLGNIVCLLSNLKEVDHEYLKQVMDLNLFNLKFLSYKMGMAKPDTDIYQAVIDELGTNNFYFFDDTLANVNEAKKLGIDAYQILGENISDIHIKKLLKK